MIQHARGKDRYRFPNKKIYVLVLQIKKHVNLNSSKAQHVNTIEDSSYVVSVVLLLLNYILISDYNNSNFTTNTNANYIIWICFLSLIGQIIWVIAYSNSMHTALGNNIYLSIRKFEPFHTNNLVCLQFYFYNIYSCHKNG